MLSCNNCKDKRQINYYMYKMFCLVFFLCHLRIFHSYGDVKLADEGLQILTYARHSRPLNSESSFACHTFCDTRHLFIMVISVNPYTHSYCRAFEGELSLPAAVFTTKVCRGWDANTQPSACLPTAPPPRSIIRCYNNAFLHQFTYFLKVLPTQ